MPLPMRFVAIALAGFGLGALPAWAQAGPERGARAFQPCLTCHSATADDTAGPLGPNLAGVVGRRIASLPGYDYSPALRAFAAREGVWSEVLLERFIAAPQATVPGTLMPYFGLATASRRAAVVEYLKATGR